MISMQLDNHHFLNPAGNRSIHQHSLLVTLVTSLPQGAGQSGPGVSYESVTESAAGHFEAQLKTTEWAGCKLTEFGPS